ncbi:type II CRISPR-associated endonuclease Cas1 [Treponema sp.]|uniref:type II CRISPR-associated endonuclease Cas1 n=1 Tax=Treponema sp. TaxID=166 RepID=UPI0025ECD0B3|nr:type II CRISPR-associated endonuclease Cas1 [Treponema sp.]MBR4321868.1 type II CRISPR-associated endonuclease Cas1 [Treponema sp.]
MIKRTLFFSNAVCLTLKNKQLVIQNKETREESSVPIEDIGFVIIENNQVYISIPVINALAENNAAVVFCNENHLPFSMNLPLDCNTIQNQLFTAQIEASIPAKKKCWKQIIEQKIKNQAKVLEKYKIDSVKLKQYASEVKSGDSTNREAMAAKLYWDLLIDDVDWVRTRFGEYPNNLLNYGYAILRAATARALIGSGLLPTLGIHHHNKYDAYALADDIMEPYRPYIDDEIIEYMKTSEETEELTREFKKKILTVLTRDVEIGKVTRPLMIALTITSSSLAKIFSGDAGNLSLPEFTE